MPLDLPDGEYDATVNPDGTFTLQTPDGPRHCWWVPGEQYTVGQEFLWRGKRQRIIEPSEGD